MKRHKHKQRPQPSWELHNSTPIKTKQAAIEKSEKYGRKLDPGEDIPLRQAAANAAPTNSMLR